VKSTAPRVRKQSLKEAFGFTFVEFLVAMFVLGLQSLSINPDMECWSHPWVKKQVPGTSRGTFFTFFTYRGN
jgi:hypothetical protein